MSQINIDFTRPAQTEITLGVAGENLATEIIVDCRGALDTWPDALFSLIIRRADGTVYPAYPPTAPDEGGRVTFAVTAMETAISGWGYMEIRATQGDVIVKTKRIKTLVLSSVTDAPVPPQPDWVTELFEALAEGGGGGIGHRGRRAKRAIPGMLGHKGRRALRGRKATLAKQARPAPWGRRVKRAKPARKARRATLATSAPRGHRAKRATKATPGLPEAAPRARSFPTKAASP